MTRYMVSYWIRNGLCGNQTFDDLPAAEVYAAERCEAWCSWSLYRFDGSLAIALLTLLASHQTG